jgi:hypothetical protein
MISKDARINKDASKSKTPATAGTQATATPATAGIGVSKKTSLKRYCDEKFKG